MIRRPNKVSLTSPAERVARLSFFLYVIFMVVGTMPLRDGAEDVRDITTSNPINQVVDTVIPFVSLLCLWPRRSTVLSLLIREKYLTLFLTWCLITILWSDFTFESFKLWIRLFGSTIVILALLLNLKSPDEALKYLRAVFAIYIPVTFLAIAFIPAATQWEFPAWRGLTSHKNTLGQISFISTIIWAFAVQKAPSKKRIVPGLFLIASLILVVGTKSSTNLIILLTLLMLSLYLFAERRFRRPVSLAILGCALILFFLGNAFKLEDTTQAFGKDATLTGRTDLWDAVLSEIETHPFIGCGFGGFWIPTNPSVLTLYEDDKFPWLPNEAHDGYLDLLNETGYVGLFMLTLIVVSYFKNLTKLRKAHSWKWFFIGVLILNVTESTLFRSSSLTGWFFIFSYVALHVELLQSGTFTSVIKIRSAIPRKFEQFQPAGTRCY